MTVKNAKNLKDYNEKMWFLGTDVLTESDLDLMDQKRLTSFDREEGAIYYIGSDKAIMEQFYMQGYSQTFLSIMNEAFERKYVWLFFDRDIVSHYKK